MIILTADGPFDAGPYMRAVKSLAARFPGGESLQINVGTSHLNLGPAWRVSLATGLLIALSEFGDVEVVG